MNLNLNNCNNLSNITEEDVYQYIIDIVEIINKEKVDAYQILDCLINIISSYSIGYYELYIQELTKIENWILQVWNPFSLEMTEKITFIALNLQLKKICNKIKMYIQNDSLPEDVLMELEESIDEINKFKLCEDEIYLSKK